MMGKVRLDAERAEELIVLFTEVLDFLLIVAGTIGEGHHGSGSLKTLGYLLVDHRSG